ncbi:MAG TPA: CoA ester lyase [Ensifer sp.]|nr:CoA ester lyase [Ensifer sp.]
MTVSHSRRSMLCLPASNAKALAKLAILECDATIYDLEDAVAPDMKVAAREALVGHFAAGAKAGVEHVIRINALSSPWGEADLEAVARCRPDAVLVPKVESAADLAAVAERLDGEGLSETRLMAMIETPKGVLNAAAIAEAHAPRLSALIVGLNDLRKDTKVPRGPDRRVLVPWLMQVVLAARAYGVAPVDAVSNDFRDLAAFEAECAEGRSMGYDGKMLIHPAQIEPANRHFGPSDEEIAAARRIVAAFDAPEAQGQGAINIDGEMVERLHLDEARKLLALVSS